jgi:hypothetical protein
LQLAPWKEWGRCNHVLGRGWVDDDQNLAWEGRGWPESGHGSDEGLTTNLFDVRFGVGGRLEWSGGGAVAKLDGGDPIPVM